MGDIIVGDVVKFLADGRELYSYDVPKVGTIGVVEMQTHSFGLEQMLGVKIPMSIVKWENGEKIAVFTHDLSKVDVSTDDNNRLNKIPFYSGDTIN